MSITSAEIQGFLKLLAEAPRRIASASNGLESVQLNFKPDSDTWAANEILAHVRSAADVWGKSIREMLMKENPTIRYISPRTWIKKTNYLQLDFPTSWQAYHQQREELLSLLNGLTVEDWLRRAMIKERQETVFSYAKRITQHEQEHCEQIETLLKLLDS